MWALKQAIPARFQADTSFLWHPTNLDRVYRLVGNGATAEAALMESRDGALIGKPAYEWSSLGTSTNTSATIAIAGNVNAAYTIVDRLGLTAVPIPALFSGNTAGGIGYPTGQSGLVIWGRTGAGIVNVNALRVLTVR